VTMREITVPEILGFNRVFVSSRDAGWSSLPPPRSLSAVQWVL
jgi:hypothetical protein